MEPAQSPEAFTAEAFYAGAHGRIIRNMYLIGIAAVGTSALAFDLKTTGGIAAGMLVAILNFRWLEKTVKAFVDKAISPQEGGPATFTSVFRYLLLALSVYVIFKSSVISLHGFLAGLFLPVPAILLEAAYETYVALRRGL